MISNFDNCLFVHVPKVAGQSIELAFLQRANLSWQQRNEFLLKKNIDPKMGPPRLAHLTATEYCQLGYVAQEQFDNMYRFAFVRNPWDRLVSEYVYRQYPFSFNDFLYKYFPTSQQDNYVKGFDGYRHVMPQFQFLYDSEGELLVDFVGRFENLQNDFAAVTTKIIGSPMALPYRNKSGEGSNQWLNKAKKIMKLKFSTPERKHYQEYFDSSSVQWVNDHYAKDISLFNYKF